MPTKILYIQVSEVLLKSQRNELLTKYIDYIYSTIDGFHRASEHYLELPLWIAEISGAYKSKGEEVIEQILHLTEENYINQFLNYYANYNADVIFMSITNISKVYQEEILKVITDNIKVIIGGYTKIKDSKCTWFNSISKFRYNELGLNNAEEYEVSYDIFNKYQCTLTIPRLKLRDGCKNKCNFCSVTKKYKYYTPKEIYNQTSDIAFNLNYSYIYINNKTFLNTDLVSLDKATIDLKAKYSIANYIVQTTVAELSSVNIAEWYEHGIRYIELGIEALSDTVYKKYNKPQSIFLIKSLFRVYRALHTVLNGRVPKLIPNVIFGFPEMTLDDYINQLEFYIKYYNKGIISHFNIYLYNNTSGDTNILPDDLHNEQIELFIKTFLPK